MKPICEILSEDGGYVAQNPVLQRGEKRPTDTDSGECRKKEGKMSILFQWMGRTGQVLDKFIHITGSGHKIESMREDQRRGLTFNEFCEIVNSTPLKNLHPSVINERQCTANINAFGQVFHVAYPFGKGEFRVTPEGIYSNLTNIQKGLAYTIELIINKKY